MAKQIECLFGYDIADDRNRKRALRILRAQCMAFQDSVFEVRLNNRELKLLSERLLSVLDEETDRLFCAQLSQLAEPWQLGTGPLSPRGNLLVIS